MPLSPGIISRIRDEIGTDTDFSDDDASLTSDQLGSLEDIYLDEDRGNLSVIRTALICWRRRESSYQARGFDSTASGSLMARRQRMRYLQSKVREYELLVDSTLRHQNSTSVSSFAPSSTEAEF